MKIGCILFAYSPLLTNPLPLPFLSLPTKCSFLLFLFSSPHIFLLLYPFFGPLPLLLHHPLYFYWPLHDYHSYISEGAANRVTMFNKTTYERVATWGGSSTQEGSHLSLANPRGLIYDLSTGTLYIADSGHQRIVALQVFFILFYIYIFTSCSSPPLPSPLLSPLFLLPHDTLSHYTLNAIVLPYPFFSSSPSYFFNNFFLS